MFRTAVSWELRGTRGPVASTSLVGFASANRMGSGLQAFGVGVQPVARGILRSSIRYDVGDWFYSSRSGLVEWPEVFRLNRASGFLPPRKTRIPLHDEGEGKGSLPIRAISRVWWMLARVSLSDRVMI